jgi:hypothetical protein
MKRFFLLLFTGVAINSMGAGLTAFNSPLNHVSADTDSVFRKRSVSVGANYGSDVQFFGRTGAITYPFVSTDVVYNTKSGWFLYGSAVKVLGYQAAIDEADLGAGYFYKYSKKFSGSIDYSRFIFNENSAKVIKSASSNDINWKNSFDWNIAKSSIILDYLFGDANDYFITLNTSKYIETGFGIFDDKDYLSFTPGISVIFGTQNFVGKYSDQHPDLLDLENYYIQVSTSGPAPLPRYNNGRFTALNYSLKVPIAYNRPHYTLEASWKYSIPVNVEGLLKNRHEVFFNLTFYYLFF